MIIFFNVYQGMTAELQPCDQPQGVNRLLKQRVYAALDNEILARICRQVNINFEPSGSSGAEYEIADGQNLSSFVELNEWLLY